MSRKKHSILKCKKLMLDAGKLSHHRLRVQSKRESWPYWRVVSCRLCGSTAQWAPKQYEENVWSPWWGSLLDDKNTTLWIEEIPTLVKCWGYPRALKQARETRKLRNDLLEIAKTIKDESSVIAIRKILLKVYHQTMKGINEKES